MIRRLVRRRAVQFGAVVAVVIAGHLLHQARPRDRGALPRPDSFFVPTSADRPDDPERIAIRILRAHTRFPAAGPDVAAAEIRAVSTVADGDRLADKIRGELQRLRDGYPGGTTGFWVGPLGLRSADDGPDRMRVDVWFSRVVAPPRLPLYQEWRVAKVTLAREGGVWRLADYDDMPGPRPGAHAVTTDLLPADVSAVSPFEAVSE